MVERQCPSIRYIGIGSEINVVDIFVLLDNKTYKKALV
jgi:hypothetical protein